MAIKYQKLFDLLKAKGISEYALRKNGISPSILAKLKNHTGGMDHRTVNRLCALLNCQPADLMEYVRSDDDLSSIVPDKTE